MLMVLLSPLNAERIVELALRICTEPQEHAAASQKVVWQSAMIGSSSCKRHGTAETTRWMNSKRVSETLPDV